MDQASQVREKVDIVSLISEYIQVKKAGHNFKANCPFHNEKTPSFVVSPERQIWHCFGCSKGGDCFSFLMEYEHMEFPEALRVLAKRAGIEIKENFQQKTYSQKEKIFLLNNLTAKFYNYILLNHSAGKRALDYLIKEREMSKPLIETYNLGFSPSVGTALVDFLIKKKKFDKKDLLQAGLAFERSGRLFDFFKNRIIFPLTDHRGNIVGFSGRVLNPQDMPKYINTRDTLVYHKGDLFFGLDTSKEEIKKQEQAILVEGEFDAISMYKEGIKNVVAVKGTAVTENQVALLARFSPKVSLCLDQDNAGFEAIKRSLAALEKKGLTTTVIIPNGKDPDEAIKKDAVEFKKAIKKDTPVYDFLLEKALQKNDKNNVLEKKKITDELLPFLAQIENEVIKEHYLKKLSKEIDSSFESLGKEIEKIKTGKKEDRFIFPKTDKRPRREVLEEYLMAMLVQKQKKDLLDIAKKNLENYVFFNLSYQKIFEKMEDINFSKSIPKELSPSYDKLYLLPLPGLETEDLEKEEIKKTSLTILNLYLKDKIKKLSEEVRKEKVDLQRNLLEGELNKLLSLLSKNK